MKIVLIAALAKDGTIGHEGKIPWHISDDLKRFKQLTMGHALLMGRKTFESIGKPLPGRRNLVLTRNPDFRAPPDIQVFSTLESALQHCSTAGESVVYVIGGAEIYSQALGLADELLLTRVHKDIVGSTKFPRFNPNEWVETAREDYPEYSFVTYTRLCYA